MFSKIINKRFIYLFIIFISIFSYLNSIKGNFVLDDEELIVNNPYIKNFKYIKKIFVSDFFNAARSKEGEIGYYRPIVTLSYLIDFYFWKLNPFGFHITNIILHLLNSFLIFYFIFILFKNENFAFVSAFIFALHPIHTENVSWISGRTDLIVSIFFFLSLIFYIIARNKNSLFYLIFSFLFFLFALLSKEIAYILPLVIFFIEYYIFSNKKNSLYYFLFFLLFLFIFLFFRFIFVKNISSFNFYYAFINFQTFIIKALPLYLLKLIFPFNLNIHIPINLLQINFLNFALFIIIFFIIILLFLLLKKFSNKIFMFAYLFFLFSLLPVSNIINISLAPDLDFTFAERFLYIPSFAFAIFIAHFLLSFLSKKIFYFFILIIFITFSFTIYHRNLDWQNEEQLIHKALKISPDSPLLYNKLGSIYLSKNKYDEAFNYFEKAFKLNPNYVGINNNLGHLLLKNKQYDKALFFFNRELNLNPNNAEVWNNIGNIFNELNEYEKAIAAYNKALEKNPDYFLAYNNIGIVLSKIKKFDLAEQYFLKALDLYPLHYETLNNIGLLYTEAGQYDKAYIFFEKVLELKPDWDIIYNNLGTLFFKKGDIEKALDYYKKALSLNDMSVNVNYNLGLLYQQINKKAEAKLHFEKLLKILPPESALLDDVKNRLNSVSE
ncbi:MAG TPA: tetratricopeptide repeat protein [bacterium]|nr:tetratricopeptide repeat protein [bacterium]HPQ18160.1 tetratricopeptide repeat protein [bacterium]